MTSLAEIRHLDLEGVVVITPRRFADDRGYFSEVWNRRDLADAGIYADFVQDNQSLSRAAGTVRGLHAQASPHAQAKLVRVLKGRILDVAVDIRRGSLSYGKWVSAELSAENGSQIFIPAGFLHGFITLEPETEVHYKCSDIYAPDCEISVRFDDPDLGIDWGVSTADATLSEKDAAAASFRDLASPFD